MPDPDLSTSWLGLPLSSPLVVGAAAPLSEDPDQLLLQGSESSGESLSYLPDAEWFSVGEDLYLRHLEQARASLAVPVIASLNGAHYGRTPYLRSLQTYRPLEARSLAGPW